ncbi:MAG: SBBP repeat-containing protein [Bryobacteraceae bacterium]
MQTTGMELLAPALLLGLSGFTTLAVGQTARQLSFETNEGQAGAGVKFLARSSGSTLFFSDTGVVFALSKLKEEPPVVCRMRLVGADRAVHAQGTNPTPGKINYFIGNDARDWHRDIFTYAGVTYEHMYRGIDLTFYGNQHQVEYDYVVAPHADAGVIRLGFPGSKLQIDSNGDLIAGVGSRKMRFHRPTVYQPLQSGSRESVEGRYSLLRGNLVGFVIAPYDHARSLVIDPVITYSTYLGGSDDEGIFGIKRDFDGNIYVAGETSSTNFPIEGGVQRTLGGQYDAFVSKFDPSGSHLIYSTYLGGSLYDHCVGLDIDLAGNAYIAGVTLSPDFPTFHAIQSSLRGKQNAFAAELDPSGSHLVFSTYLGGSGSDSAGDIAVGIDRSIYVDGFTNSPDFPVTGKAYQKSCDRGLNHGFCTGDAFATKLSPGGAKMIYSTYLGGSSTDSANGIAVDLAGAAYVTGLTYSSDFPTKEAYQSGYGGSADAFLTKLNPEGTGLVFSTYFGGSSGDDGMAIALDIFGNIFVTGTTSSTDFPTLNAFQSANNGGPSDGFVAKFHPDGRALTYSSYIGGSGWDVPIRVAADLFGSASLIGFTTSTDFPVYDAVQRKFAGGFSDAFVAKISPAGSVYYSTYLGGSGSSGDFGYAINSDLIGTVWVGGSTSSLDFPVHDAFQPKYAGGPYDAFLTKLEMPVLVEPLREAISELIGSELQEQEAEPLLVSLAAAQQHLENGDRANAMTSLRAFDGEMQRLMERGHFQSTGAQLRACIGTLLDQMEHDSER